MRFAIAVVMLGALTAPAAGQATIAEFDRAMQWRTFENRQDFRDFVPIQRFATVGRMSELDGTLREACTRFLQRATADADALAFTHITCARLSGGAATRIRHYEAALGLSEAARAKAHLALAAEVEDGARAARHIEAAIAHNPDDPYPYLARARMHQGANDLAAALRDLDRAMTLAPGQPADYVMRAELNRASGRLDAATADFVSAMERGGPEYTRFVQDVLKTIGVDPGTTAASLREAVAACMRGTPCGAYLSQWVALTPKPACSRQAMC